MDLEFDEQIQITMGLRRVVSAFARKLRRDKSAGASAARVVGERIDGTGQVAVGETGRVNLGHGRGHKSPRAIFRPYLFHAQGCGVAVELCPVQPRESGSSRIAGRRPEGFAARRRDGV